MKITQLTTDQWTHYTETKFDNIVAGHPSSGLKPPQPILKLTRFPPSLTPLRADYRSFSQFKNSNPQYTRHIDELDFVQVLDTLKLYPKTSKK